jgi:hypothetical protein
MKGIKQKMANRVSHRSTTYPCYLPVLGEFSRSWSYRFADAKVGNKLNSPKGWPKKCNLFISATFNLSIVLPNSTFATWLNKF